MAGATPSSSTPCSLAHFLPSASCSVVISTQWLRHVFWIPYSVSPRIFIALFSTFPAIWEQSPLLSSPWSRRRKRGSGWIASSLWSHPSPNWIGQSYLFSSNWFFDREHFCINITMIVTDPAVQDFLLLGLGFCILVYFIFHPGQKSRFWPCDVVMRKKEGHWGGEWPDLCSLSWVWQNQTSERNALLPGCYSR